MEHALNDGLEATHVTLALCYRIQTQCLYMYRLNCLKKETKTLLMPQRGMAPFALFKVNMNSIYVAHKRNL